MLDSRFAIALLCGLGFLIPPSSARTLTLSELAQALLRKNPDLISRRTAVEEAQTEQKGVGRLNTPSLTANTLYTGIHNEDQSLPAKTDQKQMQLDAAVTGRLYRWGLGYSLSYAYANQKQDPFLTFPSVQKDGETVTLGVEYDLFRDAGFRVGALPVTLAAQKVKAATVEQRATIQNLSFDLVGRYLRVWATQAQIDSAKAILLEAEDLKKHYKALFDEGRVSKVEYLSSEVQVATLHSAVQALNSLHKQQMRELLAFSGAADDAKSEDMAVEPLPVDYITAEKVDGLRASAERRGNGDVLALEAERRVFETEVEDLANKALPSVKLVGGKSWVKNVPNESVLSESDVRSDRWFVGVKLAMPLDGLGPRTDVAAKRVEAGGVAAKQKALSESIDTRVHGLFLELTALDEQLKTTQELERLNNERFQATLPLLERMSTARLDIFDFQNQLREERARIAEIQSAILRARAEILYLNGTLQLR